MEKDEQPNILALSWELGLWTLVVFGLLLFALKRLAWGPMLEGLQNREAGIRSALEEARKAREEAQALRDQFQKEIEASRASAQAIVADARKNADRLAEERQQKATADIQTERERLHRELDAARDQALQQIRQQAGDLAVLVSGKVLRRQLNLDDHRQLVDEALADLRRAGDERQRTVVGV
jgi:F-type H+-transporting ATPase subunit b